MEAEKQRVGYMISGYPSRSHTFIRREIEELEKNGLAIYRFSQRKFAETEIKSKLDQQEFDSTSAILPLIWIQLVRCHLLSAIKQPARYLSCLVDCLSRRPIGLSGPVYALGYFVQGIYLSEFLKSKEIQFLHIHFVNSGYQVGVTAAAYLNIPWGTSVHGRSDFDFPGVRLLRHAIIHGRFLRCISQFGASQAMRQCPAEKWNKIFVAYSGIPDTAVLQESGASIRSLRPPTKLIVVGRLSEEKGQMLMLHAAYHLKLNGFDFRLTFIGSGPDRELLDELAHQLALSNICEFVGAVAEEEVFHYLQESDILVCPSLMEGLPQVLMEAMAMKKPVVAPLLAGIPELVEHQHNGILYQCGSWKLIYESIALLLGNKELYRRCSINGLGKVKDQFIISKTIEPLLAKLKEEV